MSETGYHYIKVTEGDEGYETRKSSVIPTAATSPTHALSPLFSPFKSPFLAPTPKGNPIFDFSSPHHREKIIAEEEGSSIAAVFWNLINAIVGAGIVGLPYTFKQSGLVIGLISMVLVAQLSAYSLRMMMKTAKYAKINTYEDLCEFCFGNIGFYLVSAAMFLFDFGAMLTYLIIMGDAAESLVGTQFGWKGQFVRRMCIATLSCAIILPLCLLRDVSKLEKVSFVSVLTVLLINCIVIYEMVKLWDKPKLPIVYFNSDFPSALGTIAFAFVCQDSAFLMYNSLRNPTTKRQGRLVHLSMIGACVICCMFGLFGYLTFRGDCVSNLLNNYDGYDPVVQVGGVAYVFTMALTYPLSFYVARHVIYAIIFRGPDYRSAQNSSLSTHLLISLPLFGITLLIVMFVKDLGLVMSITGSVAAVFIAFILPAACYLRIQPSPLQFWIYKKGVWKGFKFVVPSFLLLVFGVLAAILSTGQTILNQLNIHPFGE